MENSRTKMQPPATYRQRDDMAMLYTHERIMDVEAKLKAVLTEYERLCAEVVEAKRQAQEAQRLAHNAQSVSILLRADMAAYAAQLQEWFTVQTGMPAPALELFVPSERK